MNSFTTGLKALLSASTLLLVTTAQSQTNALYLAGQFGNSEIESIETLITSDVGESNTSAQFKEDNEDRALILLGGYRLSANFGFELGYLDLGEFGATGNSTGSTPLIPAGSFNATTEIDGFGFGLSFFFPLNTSFELTAKAGLLSWDSETRINTTAGALSSSDSGTDPYLGIGGAFNLDKNIQITLGFDRYDADDVAIEVVYLGGRLYFK